MCGIFGIIEYKEVLDSKQKQKLINSLGKESMDRGEHASGYATLKPNKKLQIRKKAVKASEFPVSDKFSSNILIGHTRYATCGSNEDGNAHPFLSSCGRYAFAHNGVATRQYNQLKEENKQLRKLLQTPVDSEAMLRYLEIYGFDAKNLAKFYEAWEGASFAISMVDSKEESVVLFHNNGNKIWISHIKELGLYAYASTKKILEESLSNAELPKVDSDSFDTWELQACKRYEIKSNGEITILSIPYELPVSTYSSSRGWGGRSAYGYPTAPSASSFGPTEEVEETDDNPSWIEQDPFMEPSNRRQEYELLPEELGYDLSEDSGELDFNMPLSRFKVRH